MPPRHRITECKLVLLGDSNVGKSSLVLRFVKNQFNADQVTTVGAAFLQSPVPLDDSEDKIQFGIWDTAGSERYKALAPMYYRGAEAAIVVYDITSFESFEGAKSWVRELKLYGQPNVVVALAANKCDLEQYRAVSTHEGQAYARENELTYFETSAKSAHNVRRMFVELGAHATATAATRCAHAARRAARAKKLTAVCVCVGACSPARASQGRQRARRHHDPRQRPTQTGRRVRVLTSTSGHIYTD